MSAFIYGVLSGAGALALAQNLGDYRIDTEFMEYVVDPVKNFLLHLFGKATVSRLELKGKAVLHDTAAKLDNLLRAPVTSVEDLVKKVETLAGEVKAKF